VKQKTSPRPRPQVSEKSNVSVTGTRKLRSELIAVLKEGGVWTDQHQNDLDEFDARSETQSAHLSEAEFEDIDSLPRARKEHVDSCRECRDLSECHLSQERVEILAAEAAMGDATFPFGHGESIGVEADASSPMGLVALSSRN